MTPAKLDLTVYQGATFRKSFQWMTGTPAVPVNLTGYDIRMMVRSSVVDAAYMVSLTLGNGITITDAEAGKFEVYISPEQTKGFNKRAAVYDIEFAIGSDVDRVIEGGITISPEVTR